MKIVFDAVTAAAICGLIILFMRAAASFIVSPIKTGKELQIYAVLSAKGGAEGLEQAIRSLEHLNDGNMTVIILDEGMDDEARKIAGISQRERRNVAVVSPEEFRDKISEII